MSCFALVSRDNRSHIARTEKRIDAAFIYEQLDILFAEIFSALEYCRTSLEASQILLVAAADLHFKTTLIL